MNEKPVKVEIDFNEALRRIAQTPKDSVVKPKKPVVNNDLKVYNDKKGAATKPPRLLSAGLDSYYEQALHKMLCAPKPVVRQVFLLP